jgi:hypothetical protein
LGRTDEAIQQLQDQIELDPKESRAYKLLQSIYEEQGAPHRAAEVHQQYLSASGAVPNSRLTKLQDISIEHLVDKLPDEQRKELQKQIPPPDRSGLKGTVQYFFDEQTARKVSGESKFDVAGVLSEAFLQWENATNGTVHFERNLSKHGATIVCDFTSDPKQLHHDTALGTTRVTGALGEQKVVVIDLLSSFPLLDGTPREQFMHVALHEIGHAMRLDHSSNKDDIMYATVGRPIRTTLSTNDKARVQALYQTSAP